jgi:hypothetical protein
MESSSRASRSISGKMRFSTMLEKNSSAASCSASTELPALIVTISPHITVSSTLPCL